MYDWLYLPGLHLVILFVLIYISIDTLTWISCCLLPTCLELQKQCPLVGKTGNTHI